MYSIIKQSLIETQGGTISEQAAHALVDYTLETYQGNTEDISITLEENLSCILNTQEDKNLIIFAFLEKIQNINLNMFSIMLNYSSTIEEHIKIMINCIIELGTKKDFIQFIETHNVDINIIKQCIKTSHRDLIDSTLYQELITLQKVTKLEEQIIICICEKEIKSTRWERILNYLHRNSSWAINIYKYQQVYIDQQHPKDTIVIQKIIKQYKKSII